MLLLLNTAPAAGDVRNAHDDRVIDFPAGSPRAKRASECAVKAAILHALTCPERSSRIAESNEDFIERQMYT